jgi:outer membrane murein-binding lipoprotein Lpp
MMALRPLSSCGLVLLAVLAAGCGTSTDRDQASLAVQRLYAAVQQHDGTTACAQMSPDLRAALVKDEGDSCAKAALKLTLHGDSPSSVRVYADEAAVRLAGGDTVFLSATKEGWRVDAVGCRPQGKGPYDCEEQA